MPKMKTHSGTKKRFKITGNGSVKRWRIRHLRKSGTVSTSDMKRISQMIKNCD